MSFRVKLILWFFIPDKWFIWLYSILYFLLYVQICSWNNICLAGCLKRTLLKVSPEIWWILWTECLMWEKSPRQETNCPNVTVILVMETNTCHTSRLGSPLLFFIFFSFRAILNWQRNSMVARSVISSVSIIIGTAIVAQLSETNYWHWNL